MDLISELVDRFIRPTTPLAVVARFPLTAPADSSRPDDGRHL